MLIVMAVVVVLAAASMPKIGSTLEGARESNDLAAISAAYTEAYTKVAMAASDGALADAEKTQTVTGVAFSQTEADWNFQTPKIAGIDISDSTSATGGTYKWATTDGASVDLDFVFSGTTMDTIALTGVKKHTTG